MAPNETPTGTNDTTDAYAAGLAPEATHPGAPEVAPPAPRKRASRRVSKSATTIGESAGATPEPTPTDAPATEPVTEPTTEPTTKGKADKAAPAVKKPTRKRASRSKKAAAVETADALESVAVAEGGAATGKAVVDDEAIAVDLLLPDLFESGLAGDDDEDDELDGDAEATLPAVPSFNLLFQAPDASAASSRRRRSRVVEPVEAADDAEDEPEILDAEAPTGDADEHDDHDDREAEAADEDETPRRSRRRRGGKGRRGRGAADGDESGAEADSDADSGDADERGEGADEHDADGDAGDESSSSRRRRRRRRAGSAGAEAAEDAPNVSTRVRQPRAQSDEPVAVKGSTRLEAKKQRRREGREAGRRRTVITEAEFLARREAVDRVMVVRNKDGRTQMGVLEDGVLVEHYIDQATTVSMAGNIYLGRVQNVLPSMEAAFIDIGKGRNAVLYAGEVNWDAAGMDSNQPKRIENALSSGQTVLVQVTKDPIGHKGARLTSQISLPGRYLVYVPNSAMTGISRKLPDTERARLKKILRDVVPDTAGVIVRTAAEGASEEELRADVERLTKTWEDIQARAEGSATPKAGKSRGKKKNGGSGSSPSGSAPLLLHGEPDLTVRVIRDVFNEDFKQLVVSGEQAWNEIHSYITSVAPDLADRVSKWTAEQDLFTHHRVDEQLAKAMDRKVWLPSGGSLVIDRTEAMTVVDVNTGKFVGSGGNLEETVTKNNLEAAEEIVRQLRLRDIGGIIVIDFIDMVLESNRELVVRRLLECLGRDRTKHQVAEVTSLGLVQMTRKRVGSGLIEVFSETCEHCNGRGFVIHTEPVSKGAAAPPEPEQAGGRTRRGRRGATSGATTTTPAAVPAVTPEPARNGGPTAAQIAAAAHAAAVKAHAHDDEPLDASVDVVAEAETQAPPTHDGPHAFPVDDGPWGGSDAQAEGEPEPGDAPPVEVESALEPEVEPDVEPEAPAADEPVAEEAPATKPRRRRGRVMAPAGPPKSANEPTA